MDTNSLFGKALGLGDGWKVVKSEMDIEARQLRLWLDFEVGSYFACPQCGEFCPVHDTSEKTWRHLDFWQHGTELVARVPRVVCQEHGVLQTEVPWARSGSGFTLMMEAMVLLLCQQMPVKAAASHLGETDQRLWRVVEHYVMKAHAAEDWSAVRRVMIDETSTKKGHHYATNFMDADTRKLLFTVQGKDQETIGAFADEMTRHNAHAGQVTELIMDMSTSFIAGARRFFSGARVIFDHFHIMQLVGKAVDAVRKSLVANGADLTGGMWAIRGNEWTRSEKQQDDRRRFIKDYPILGRAIGLRESLQDILADNEPGMLKWWCGWASRSRLKPFRQVAKSIKNHWDGILAFMETRLTNAAMEAVNGVLQLAKRMARGFRNFNYFRIMAYLKAGRLQLNVPHF